MQVIYGIDESDFRCGGCIEAKRLFTEAGLPFEFKRIVIRNESGDPEYNKEFMEELRQKVHFTTLKIPYIFIDHDLVPIGRLKEVLIALGHDKDLFD